MSNENKDDWKESLLNSIKESEIELTVLLNKINKFDGVITLLSVLDAQENELNLIMQKLELEGGKVHETYLLSYSNSYEQYYIILSAINYLLQNSKNSKS